MTNTGVDKIVTYKRSFSVTFIITVSKIHYYKKMTDICNNNSDSQCQEQLVSKEVQCLVKKLMIELKITDYTMNISAGSIKGDNYLGIIAKVQINGKCCDGKMTTLNLICKSAPREGTFRKLAPVREVYGREIYIYSKVLPEFCKLQQERGVINPFKSYAKYYSSMMEECHEALIMEDMKALGYELRDRQQVLDYNHVKLVLEEYGKLHALSFALRDQKPELFKELAKNSKDLFFSVDTSDEFYKALSTQAERALKSLDPIVHKFAHQKFVTFHNKIKESVQTSVKSESIEDYSVIGHGDCWVNNMLFKYSDSKSPQKPTNLCLLDWQLSRLGSPALDLSYFIFTCTDQEFRKEHHSDLIKIYYKSFCDFLRQLGSDPDKLFPYDVLLQHMKKYSVYGLCLSLMVLFLMTSDVDEIPDIHNVSELENFSEKLQYEAKNLQKYFSRIRGVILDFVKFQYDF